MARTPRTAAGNLAAERRDQHQKRRYEAMRLMIERGALGLSPNTAEGRDVGLMVGLEKDGLALRRPERDRIGDLVFDATEAARLWANYPDIAPADSSGMTHREMREMYAEVDRYMADQRRRALIALWAPPVVDAAATSRRRDGVICYRDNRDEDWTLWRAVQATIGLLLVRYWSDKDQERWSRRLKGRLDARWGIDGHAIAYWDAGPVYGGYTVEVLRLYPGFRVEHFNDGEINL
ncbi:MAG: hypothetical protein KF842_14665 [Caulobacter sp.]|nr:hypothetical protein [Caulobacter sp.]